MGTFYFSFYHRAGPVSTRLDQLNIFYYTDYMIIRVQMCGSLPSIFTGLMEPPSNGKDLISELPEKCAFEKVLLWKLLDWC